MPYYVLCAAIFFATALINITMITVFYHRALAHKALELPRATRWFVVNFGIWLTGLDPKGWVCMHRAHHAHSDTELDPHSPVHYGLFGVFWAQLKSYERSLVGLARETPDFVQLVPDLDFSVNWLNRKRLWLLPYAFHLGVSLILGFAYGAWTLAACYYFGIMSHPLEGGIVNSLGHAIGSRNFETDDNSRNNTLAAILIAGEGYQNNHHRWPSSPRFSYRWSEVDFGYFLCRVLEKLRILRIKRELLIPSPADFALAEAARAELSLARSEAKLSL